MLAGYMSILDAPIIREYDKKIINIHPSLIPNFCGRGMYGIKVHEAVLAAGETVTGATVHYIDEGVDTGKIILQEEVGVQPGDVPRTLQKRVLGTSDSDRWARDAGRTNRGSGSRPCSGAFGSDRGPACKARRA